MSWMQRNYALKQLELKKSLQALRRAENRERRNHEATDRMNEAFQPQLEKYKATPVRTFEQEAKLEERLQKALKKEQNIAEAEGITLAYEEIYDEVDNILFSALLADNHFDPETLRIAVDHPPFNPGATARPVPEPSWLVDPPEPLYVEPKRPSFLSKVFGLAKNCPDDVERVHAVWLAEHKRWQEYTNKEIPARNEDLKEEYIRQEKKRKNQLRILEQEYQFECLEREKEFSAYNQDLEDFIQSLNEGDASAVEEYMRIIFFRSIFPDCFTVDHECKYNSEDKELTVSVFVPEPHSIPAVKSARYVASRGEIQYSDLAAGVQKKRYNNAVYGTALRIMHEVYQADPRKLIETISLNVRVRTIDPSTGHSVVNSLVLVACGRSQFAELKLANVEPLAALNGLRAILSKNPFEGIPAILNGVEVRR